MNQDILLSRNLGLLRIGAVIPELHVADVDFNVSQIISAMEQAEKSGVQVLSFPEMAITGYTVADLVQQQALLLKTEEGLKRIADASAGIKMVIIIGAPLLIEQKIFNCAVIINNGLILGVIPKTYLPNYREFYEGRWFTSGDTYSGDIILAGQQVPFGTDILFQLHDIPPAIIGIEICEDLWIPLAPHEHQALAGATVLINLSASNEIIGKSEWRRTMIASESGRCLAAYCYVSSSISESSNDVVFSGHTLIAENSTILQETKCFTKEAQIIISDIDLERLVFDRARSVTFHTAASLVNEYRIIETEVADPVPGKLYRNIDPHPFVPADPARRAERCREIFSIQVAALAKKLTGINQNHVLLGVSGGLDSTLALLVAIKTMDYLGLPYKNVHAFSMPGFGTTRRTRNNAARLCQTLGVSFEQVDIKNTCRTHLRDLKHTGEENIVFENVQARYRTEFLFNKANQLHGIVIGTGDLTEIALGWSTYSGDHLSHYHINASVPKTLVHYMVSWVADEELAASPAQKLLYDILDTPISPELLSAHQGIISQKSEELIGPVELTDFFLYPFVRFGMRPGKILYLAEEARRYNLFDSNYTLADLHHWLNSFIKRFFANQFKRNCCPEGPKVGSVSLSPRGDWRMPSDAQETLWLEDLEQMYNNLKK